MVLTNNLKGFLKHVYTNSIRVNYTDYQCSHSQISRLIHNFNIYVKPSKFSKRNNGGL